MQFPRPFKNIHLLLAVTCGTRRTGILRCRRQWGTGIPLVWGCGPVGGKDATLFVAEGSVLLRCMSPLLAQSRHELVRCTCPLSGVERTCVVAMHESATDPKRT